MSGYDVFNPDLLIHINTALMTLRQIGVGPKEPFYITGETETWADFLGEREDLEAVKTYVYLKVRLVFDPPQSSFVADALERAASELEWRLNVEVDPHDGNVFTPEE